MTEIQTTLIDNSPVLTADDIKLIQRASRLLLMIMQPDAFERARREGYTAAEHRLGWKLVAVASGSNVAFDDLRAEAKQARGASGAQDRRLALLQRLDAFENTWVPRARAILRRAVPAARRDTFEAAFYTGVEQQPLGPGVINSVALFVGRVEGLEASGDPDAAAFRELLSARGLTDERVAEMKALVAQAQAVGMPGPAPDSAAMANMQASRAERQDAMRELRDWFADWSVGLRPVFNGREQVKLGLAGRKKKAKAPSSAPARGGGAVG